MEVACNLEEHACNLEEHACNLEEHACNLEKHACNLEEHAKSSRVAAADLEGAAPGVDDGVEHEFELQDEIGEQPQGGVVGQIHEVQHVVDCERRHTAHIHYATQKHVTKVACFCNPPTTTKHFWNWISFKKFRLA